MPAVTRLRSRAAKGRGAGSSYDADAQAYFAAASVSGGPYRSAINQFVLDLKVASVWSKFDRLWLFANEHATAALTCVKSHQLATAVNSPTFVAGDGYILNGVSQYLDSNLPLNAGGQYQRNSCSFGLELPVVNSTGNRVAMGVISDDFEVRTYGVFIGTDIVTEMNNGDVGALSAPHSSRTGFWHWVRSASNAVVGYKDGVQYDTGNGTSKAIEGVSRKFFIGGQNFGDAISSPIDGKVRSAWIGTAFSGVEAAALYTASNNYGTAIGL